MNTITSLLLVLISSSYAFVSSFHANLPPARGVFTSQNTHHGRFIRRHSSFTTTTTSSTLFLAGFGGGGGGAKNKKKKGKSKSSSGAAPPLKPKAQWDRYYDLKKYTVVPVAVRVIGGDDDGEWLEVGRIKSENDEYTEIAVARQKALIAEHSKRLYPLQVLPKDRVEWAYYKTSDADGDDDSGEWIPLDKDAGKDAPEGIEKKIGFEGKADPKTGFYCHYNAGRLVDREDEAMVKTKE
eukprot:CAMPEP_0185730062 /NCGR_PEP_ID=MMETSP1171-20130828/8314_1 /TAXON_ID=374046 /ORGANISM="Helicotheca tamensis, Strain CCMP826" /LENGTH=238 /DNA_ID=CAMNT_0028399045 /DNA_START=111 /DNA_END=827 /DNA_ORIENTATION=+